MMYMVGINNILAFLWIICSNVSDVCTRKKIHPSFGYNFTKVSFNNFYFYAEWSPLRVCSLSKKGINNNKCSL
jgi:hypothetical protein